jgi:hypothetical protein
LHEAKLFSGEIEGLGIQLRIMPHQFLPETAL